MRHTTVLLLLLLLATPTGEATIRRVGFGPDVPSIVVPYNVTFVAASFTSDGASIPASGTQYFPMFGDSAPRNAETDSLVHAAFSYKVTNFTVSSNVAGCGGLGAGQTFTFTLRVNQADTPLSVVCSSGTTAGAALKDFDVVTITAGDRLSFKVVLVGGLLGVNLRVGVRLEGFINKESVTEEVVEVTPFEDAVGLTALEFSILVVAVVLGLMVNARGRDLGSGIAGAILLLVVGLVGIAIRNVWVGGVEFAVFVLLLSGYAFVRAALDYLSDRRARSKKTDPGGPI